MQPFLLSIRQAIDKAATKIVLTQSRSLYPNTKLAVKGFLQKYVGGDTVQYFFFLNHWLAFQPIKLYLETRAGKVAIPKVDCR